jgi:selenoprotein W-related protein
VQSITLVPSDGGRFEVEVDKQLVYSKLKSGVHPAPGEVLTIIQDYLR